MRMRLAAPILACLLAVSDLTAQPDSLARGVIHGVVLDTLVRPAPGVMVQLLADFVPPSPPKRKGDTRHRVLVDIDTTDGAGRFSFASLVPRRYALIAHAVWVEGGVDSLVVAGTDTISVDIRLRVRHHAETPASVRTDRLARLVEAERRWAARRPARYRLTASVECFCPAAGSPWTLEFINDSLIATIDRRGRRRPITHPWLDMFSVPRLFAEAEAAIRNLEVVVVAIDYDPVYGVPTLIDTDIVHGLTDGWTRQRVTGFRPIP